MWLDPRRSQARRKAEETRDLRLEIESKVKDSTKKAAKAAEAREKRKKEKEAKEKPPGLETPPQVPEAEDAEGDAQR